MTTQLTKQQRKAIRITNHINAIALLANMCGGSKLQPKTISNKLRAIERRANNDAMKYANGEIETGEWDAISEKYYNEVQALFNGNLQGLKINSDCRGYALKIESEYIAPSGLYGAIGLNRDWGGYGLLAPEINGN
jgi:hypothetical protein